MISSFFDNDVFFFFSQDREWSLWFRFGWYDFFFFDGCKWAQSLLTHGLWTRALYPAGYHGFVPDPSWTYVLESYPRPELRSLEVIPDFTKIRVIPDCKWSYSLPELRSLEVIPDFTKIRVIPDCKMELFSSRVGCGDILVDSTWCDGGEVTLLGSRIICFGRCWCDKLFSWLSWRRMLWTMLMW